MFLDGSIESCLVTRFRNENKLYAICANRNFPTHVITNPKNGKTANARMKFKVRGNWMDPFDLENGTYWTYDHLLHSHTKYAYIVFAFLVIENFSYLPNNIEVGFYITGRPELSSSQVIDPQPLYELELWQVECPALVFFYLPEKETMAYDCVKFLSDVFFGINTQCFVHKTLTNQKRGPQQ